MKVTFKPKNKNFFWQTFLTVQWSQVQLLEVSNFIEVAYFQKSFNFFSPANSWTNSKVASWSTEYQFCGN